MNNNKLLFKMSHALLQLNRALMNQLLIRRDDELNNLSLDGKNKFCFISINIFEECQFRGHLVKALLKR